MAFDDNPIVDKNAERSEESVNKSRLLFAKKYGFNSHYVEGAYDYGVDIYSELISAGRALSFIFPIQIKSTKKAQHVFKNNIKYYTISFLTSRLGYLYRDKSRPGLVILYDESKDLFYYDFVWELINRIKLEKNDDSWKENATVVIHFPETNILNETNLSSIHKKCLNYFLNANSIIQNAENNGYNLYTGKDITKTYDTSKAVELLEGIATHLFNIGEYSKILSLLDIVQKKDLKRPKVAYIAALTYAETGDLFEADFYLKVCFSKSEEFTEEEFLTLEMQKFKVDFGLGGLERKELILKLKRIKEKTNNIDNIINIDININMLEISQKVGEFNFDETIFESTVNIFNSIEHSTQSEEQKHFQKVFQAENLSTVLMRMYSDFINNNLFTLDSTNPIVLEERNKKQESINLIFKRIIQYIEGSLKYAQSVSNKLLEAHAYHKLATAFFSMNLCLYINKKTVDKKPAKIILSETLNNTLKAYNLFLELQVNHEAYLAITLGYEIIRLSEEWLAENLNKVITLERVKKEMISFSQYQFYSKFNSVIDKFSQENTDDNDFSKMSDSFLELFATKFIQENKLPEERIINLLNEMKAYRLFQQKCKNSELQLITNQKYLGNDYKFPSSYAIINIKTNQILVEGGDINNLIKEIGR